MAARVLGLVGIRALLAAGIGASQPAPTVVTAYGSTPVMLSMSVHNMCDWTQTVQVEFVANSTSRSASQSQTGGIGARQQEPFLFLIAPGLRAHEIQMTVVHAETTEGAKTCLETTRTQSVLVKWEDSPPQGWNGRPVFAPTVVSLLQVEKRLPAEPVSAVATDAAPPSSPPMTGFEFPSTPSGVTPEDRRRNVIATPTSRYDFPSGESGLDFGVEFNALSDKPEVTPVTPGRNSSGVNRGVQNKAVEFEFTFTEENRLPTDRDTIPPDYQIGRPKPKGGDAWRLLVDGVSALWDQLMPRLYASGGEPLSLEQAGQIAGGLVFLMTDRGGSTGKTLDVQVLNRTGKPVRLTGMLGVEPLEKSAQNQAIRAFAQQAGKSVPTTLNVSAYCVEFLKLPPLAGQVLQAAAPEFQKQLNPLKRVMAAANVLRANSQLHPDSNPDSYADSIKQWAIWTVEQKFSQNKFAEAFLGHTKKNVEAAGQKWTKQIEDVVRQRTPNRWQDIVAILKGAGAAVPQ